MKILKKIISFEKKNRNRIKKVSKSLWGLLAIMLAWYFFFGYNYQFIYCYGPSMEPSYENGEWMIVEPARNRDITRFDVVIVDVEGERLAKRILGIEGEHVRIKWGKVFINGEELKEPYGQGAILYWQEEEGVRKKKPRNEWLFLNVDEDIGLIPKGYVFVIGDNRNESWYGVVGVKEIRSIVVL